MMKYRSYTYNVYLRAMELLNQGFGLTEVCRMLGWPETKKSLLHYCKNQRHKPPAIRWIPKPSNELAYILGVLHGDGYTVREHTYHYDIVLLVKDYEFAEAFSKTMSKLLNKKYMKPEWSKTHNRWRVYYRSKAFYNWFKRQNLESLKPYIEHSEETVANFLRGLYDSDGYNYRCKQIYLYNNDEDLLRYVQHILKKYFDVIARGPYLVKKAGSIMERNGRRYKRRENNYSIAIYRKKHVKIFLNEIGFSIKEKHLGLPRRKPP